MVHAIYELPGLDRQFKQLTAYYLQIDQPTLASSDKWFSTLNDMNFYSKKSILKNIDLANIYST